MLGRVTAGEVIREAKSGRTKPVLMLCEADTDGAVEVFCKLSAGCFEGVTSLAREVVAACLAYRSESARAHALPRRDSLDPGLSRDGP